MDWFAGFRHGAACAKESGLRHYSVIPSSLVDSHGTMPYPAQVPTVSPQEQEVVPAPTPAPSQKPGTGKGSRPVAPPPTAQPLRSDPPMPPVFQERS